MPSFDVVNYSLRASKSIQRQIVFDGIRVLKTVLDLQRAIYIGFGSIWFTDFVMAHKLLGIADMISMESDEIGYRRALFNSPYSTVKVCNDSSSVILPKLCDDKEVNGRPWVVWLDYDSEFDESLKADTRTVIEKAPDSTVFLITFNGNETKYGSAKERPERLRELFEDAVPDDLPKEKCKGYNMQKTLADFAIDFMTSVGAGSTRRLFVSAFRVLYKDSAAMVTVGGILADSKLVDIVADTVKTPDWRCRPTEPIVAPQLTIREVMTLQSELPSQASLSRESVQDLGFDLKKEQVEAYQRYYLEYPTFVQIIT